MGLTEFFYLMCLGCAVFGVILWAIGFPALNAGDWHVLLACGAPLVVVAIAWGLYKRHKANETVQMGDSQAEFVQRQRTSNAGILARSRRDRPYDKRFRRDFICEQPSAWHPTYQDLADAVDQAQNEPRIYHERQTSGKWRPTHAPRDYSDKNGG